jgi:hypothetical protein
VSTESESSGGDLTAVETFLDVYGFQPVSSALVRLALPSPVPAVGVTLLGILLGLCGASLLRYTRAVELVPAAVLLVLYALLHASGGALAHARGTTSELQRIAELAADYVVGVACVVAVTMPVASEGEDKASTWPAELGVVSAMVQGAASTAVTRRYRARSLDRAYRERLLPLARGWAYLGQRTHFFLMAVFLCAGALSAYLWLRLTAGSIAFALVALEQVRRERALVTPAPPTEASAAPAAHQATVPDPKDLEAARRQPAPISWRPPPPDE